MSKPCKNKMLMEADGVGTATRTYITRLARFLHLGFTGGRLKAV